MPRTVTSGPTADIDRQFQYDPAGRLSLTREPQHTLTYGYDAIDRLIRLNEERFAFDPAHNLLTPGATGATIPSNRVEAIGPIRYRYDVHGRVIGKNIDGATIIRLIWNDDHRWRPDSVGR
jgi:YD repeat-containing protein